jgi:hypothetical protein
MPNSFVVRAKNRQGDPVEIIVTPHSGIPCRRRCGLGLQVGGIDRDHDAAVNPVQQLRVVGTRPPPRYRGVVSVALIYPSWADYWLPLVELELPLEVTSFRSLG